MNKDVNAKYKKFFSAFVLVLMLFSLIGFVIAADELEGGGSVTPSPGSTTTPTSTGDVNTINVNINPLLDKPIENPILVAIGNFLSLGLTFKEYIIGLILLAIIIAGLYDILTLVSIFQNDIVKVIISVGLGLIFAITGVGFKLVQGMISFAAGLGAFGIVLEVIISIGVFIGLSIGNNFIARWAAKRKGQVEAVKAIESSDEASAAITGLRRIQRNFRKKP